MEAAAAGADKKQAGAAEAQAPAWSAPVAMEAAEADKMPAGAATARAPAWTRVSAPVAWAGAAAQPAGALVAPVAAAAAAAAPAPPAWARPSARLVWVLTAALFLLGCAGAGIALYAMILPAGKACAPNAEVPSMHTAVGSLVMGVFLQMLAAIMAVAGPAWEFVVWGTVMGTLIACVFPAHGVLWLFVACDGGLALPFWFFYVVLWPVAAITAAVAVKWEAEDRRPSTTSY